MPTHAAIATAHTPDGTASPRARILVVDDDPGIRRICTRCLEKLGHDVDAAEDGEVAWSALMDGVYDLVITDHEMPGLTGLGLLLRMRNAGLTAPGILISGRPPTNDPELVRHTPPLAVLPKPFSCEALVGRVNALLPAAKAR